METYVFEWLSTGVRWLHVIAGIAWLGASFYFQGLARRLRQRATRPTGAEADVWEVHGFGFFHVVQYLVPPTSMPPAEELVWYRWQANTTWLSGFALLSLVYYLKPELYLIDPAVLNMPAWAAIAASVLGLGVAWMAYDALCRSALSRNGIVLHCSAFVLFVVCAYAASRLFSPRGAFMQIGATMGTIMLANVFFFIIPSLRKLVADIPAHKSPDATVLEQYRQRSLHNNYLSLPVIFVMIGNHFPLAFATPYAWLIVSLIVLIGAAIRHFFNTMHKTKRKLIWPWCAAALLFCCVIALSGLGRQKPAPTIAAVATADSVHMADVQQVVNARCVLCHSREPVWPDLAAPPKGVVLETVEDLRNHAADINRQAVLSHAMPPANLTAITDAERERLGLWFRDGARIN